MMGTFADRLQVDEVQSDDAREERVRSRRRRKRWKGGCAFASEDAAPTTSPPPNSNSVMTTDLTPSEGARLHARNLWPRSVAPSLAAALSLLLLLCAAGRLPGAAGLRCYVCGGHSGRACLPILDPEGDLNGNREEDDDDGSFLWFGSRNSPYVRRPTPPPDERANRQWEECNDLINHKGCMKQVVNNGESVRQLVGAVVNHE